MNVFGILSSDDEETLTEENYCEKTNKDKPYYRPDISPISPYLLSVLGVKILYR